MKQLIIVISVLALTACSSLPNPQSIQELWKLQKACQFYHDVHPEEDMNKHKECNGLLLQDNKMPEN